MAEPSNDLDPVRSAALTAATTFVSSWTGRKGAEGIVFCARVFEHYLRTGEQPDVEVLRSAVQPQ